MKTKYMKNTVRGRSMAGLMPAVGTAVAGDMVGSVECGAGQGPGG